MVPKSSADNLMPPYMPVSEESYSNDSSKQTTTYIQSQTEYVAQACRNKVES